ncbi:MAG: hypothetical protein Q9203_002947 [Teloschistes exilis]
MLVLHVALEFFVALTKAAIQALQHYNEGLKPLKDFARYEFVINELNAFSAACEKLLTGLVDSESHLACLLDDPTPAAWRKEQLALRLQERLQDSYAKYCELVTRIMLAFGKLYHKIGLDSQGQRRSRTQSPSFRITFPTPSGEPWVTWHEAEIKVLERAVPAPQGRSNNIDTCATYSGGKPMSQDKPVASPMGPTVQKNISLSLERLKTKERKRVTFSAVLPGIQMSSMQISESGINTSSTEMTQETLPGSENNVILSVCSTFLSSEDMSSRTCLGRLETEQHHYEVITLGQKKQQGTNDYLTLHEIIERNYGVSIMPRNQMPNIGDSTRLTRKARLELAVMLASTALQLHTTPWLDSNWTAKCIQFANGSLQHPFVSRAYPAGIIATEVPESRGSPVRNRSIFGLGILLLELAVGRSIDCFKNSEQPLPSEDFFIASQLLDELKDNEGPGYLDAAQACIFCNFGSKAKILDLGNDSFRQAVYEDVIVPLENDVELFCRAIP